MSTHHDHEHDDNTKTHHAINQRSTPSAPQHEINTPPPKRTTPRTSTNEHPEINPEDPQSRAHLCITILRGGRAIARRRTTTPRDDRPTRHC